MGEVFGGRYELVDVLATGGSSTIWRAWDHRDGCYRAAKVLRQADSDSLLRFMRESTHEISHQHVVAPISWTGEDRRILFTMPLVRGGSVDTLVRDFGALPSGWAAELTRQTLVALAHVHQTGVIHRDVKPANLLLDATGTAAPNLYLSDFGASWHLDSPRLTQVDRVIGTPGYLAPELAVGSDPDPTQDLYSVGVVLRQLLSGEPPTREGELPAPAAPSADAERLLRWADRLTAADPAGRPGSAAAALIELAQISPRDLHQDEDPDNPIEILVHVPPLPSGWTESGPLSSPGPPLTVAPPTAASPIAPPDAEPSPTGPGGADPSGSDHPHTEVIPRSEMSEHASEAPRAGATSLSWFVPVLALVGIVLIVLAFVLG